MSRRVELMGGGSERMNVALSKQPKNQGTNHADNFQTPPSALAPLLPHLRQMASRAYNEKRDFWVWEPAAGKGNLVRGLGSARVNAFGTDLHPHFPGDRRIDFLADVAPLPFDAIVTNPPFSIKDRFIARCYELRKPWALLLPLTTFEGIQRQKMFREHGIQVIFFPRRVHFETPSGKGGSSWFATMWVTWGLNLPKDLNFADPEQYGLFGGVL